MNYEKNEIIDQIIFKLISLIDYNNTFFQQINIIDINYYININELNILKINNYINDFNEYNNQIVDDYNLFKEYKENILQNNLDNNKKKMINSNIININLDIINNLFIELLNTIKKN